MYKESCMYTYMCGAQYRFKVIHHSVPLAHMEYTLPVIENQSHNVGFSVQV